ncbi:carbohydrate ABC transporter ATP-binding protein, CUT1 family [Roseovarius litoreus]|jgi:sn-glycerol 3-phosphate transport system ATP-binding protein|uniref:Carbohydrate ABC transporter ATP-binding protein, CUT1 family n=1 Tax=Roseovarius litoreus TaxID=1155722 RepID=A0A1M7JCG9_9RHOB|nr:ABC transporter ATP-binding protein [Roseovarius litoreus]SHM50684.1 carbohydrate ABC transporter ATP-binding protein, CUT1 family [Roseovarius litoreus]
MMEDAFVQLDGVAKRWNGQLGVEDISLSIPRGSFVALLGPSGCGKSTTLRLLSGLELADEGRIIIDGKDVTTAAPSERNLSMVFQSYALFPHLSVAENVIFGLKVRKVAAAERREKLRRALEITGLLGYEARKPGELSGGQRQRVALARAIVANQPLCLMDEPLSNLDAKLRASVRKDIKKLQVDLGITVIYVTHDQTEAMSMADIVVLMKDGRIQQVGAPESLYYRSANTFVAEFVGSPPMALVEGSALPGFEGAAKIGLRAESLRLAKAGQGRLKCLVSECEFLGSETFVGLTHPAAKGLTISMPGLQTIPTGEELEIDFADEDLHFFDADGNRTNHLKRVSA